MNNIEEKLLEIEQHIQLIHKQIHSVRRELAVLKHSNKSINSSKKTVEYQDDQNRNTARR